MRCEGLSIGLRVAGFSQPKRSAALWVTPPPFFLYVFSGEDQSLAPKHSLTFIASGDLRIKHIVKQRAVKGFGLANALM